MHVNQNTFALLIDQSQRLPYLIAAIATFGSEDITGKTFGMETNEHAIRVTDVPFDQRHMLGSIHLVTVDNRFVHPAMNCREDFFRNGFDQAFGAQPITDQASHGKYFEALPLRQALQRWKVCDGAVVF